MLVVTDIHNTSPHKCLLNKRQEYLSLATLCGHRALSGAPLHQHLFESGGIDEVVRGLVDTITAPCVALGYSAGGYALWRAAMAGAPITRLFCLSSTRLRQVPPIPIPTHVFFGADDPNIPSETWMSKVPDHVSIFPNTDHSYYCDPSSTAWQETRLIISEYLPHIAQY
ncbi:hypothetical protein GCM10007939_20300 [Amylibacter marinus]|uniref:Dienelactone hydrolase domain-containing protein n=1 Tax=Amylibacter marinus TaxID=1475483 RepID=A0ABQ5VX17_9RHOB|nr:hypothetical protein [Amylibacter marinus]GLQ35747.1 hypothetical protein GCM10007939_20300 [Amylibacter marinus]